MALRDQPYLPLFIQDIMTDEKLNECSAATHGIFIKGIMCLMHKSENYGKILLKQKYKQKLEQNLSKARCFALMLVKHLPYTVDEICLAIDELIIENVCFFEGDFIIQKRMVKDNKISEIRASAGKKGGKSSQKNAHNFAKAKTQANHQANTEYENEYENEDENTNKEELGTAKKTAKNNELLVPKMFSIFKKSQPNYSGDLKDESPHLLKIAVFICEKEKLDANRPQNHIQQIIPLWEAICNFVAQDAFKKNYQLSQIQKYIVSIIQSIQNGEKSNSKKGGRVTANDLEQAHTKHFGE